MMQSMNVNEQALALAIQQPEKSAKLLRMAEVCYEISLFRNHQMANPDVPLIYKGQKICDEAVDVLFFEFALLSEEFSFIDNAGVHLYLQQHYDRFKRLAGKGLLSHLL
ncbi:MAG: hypothetical protein ACK4NN_12430 [Rheinheimera sp.]